MASGEEGWTNKVKGKGLWIKQALREIQLISFSYAQTFIKYSPQYNGKPMLVKRAAKYYRGDGYVEIDVNLHKFAYLARKGTTSPFSPNVYIYLSGAGTMYVESLFL